MVPASLSQIARFVDTDVHAASGDFVQMWLPEMRSLLFDQRDVRFLLFAKLVPELGRELEAAGAAADDHNSMQARLFLQHCLLDGRLRGRWLEERRLPHAGRV